jgi:hypothetical protein
VARPHSPSRSRSASASHSPPKSVNFSFFLSPFFLLTLLF